MLQIGSVLDGKYKILSEIGHGGMSVVYMALNEKANKTWAVKEIRKDGKLDFNVVRQGLVAEIETLKRFIPGHSYFQDSERHIGNMGRVADHVYHQLRIAKWRCQLGNSSDGAPDSEIRRQHCVDHRQIESFEVERQHFLGFG